MSDREEFENRLQVPEDALWSEKKQGYYWSNYPTVAHPFNEDWEVWQEALEYARAKSGQGAEPVAWLLRFASNEVHGVACSKEQCNKWLSVAGRKAVPLYTHPQPVQQSNQEDVVALLTNALANIRDTDASAKTLQNMAALALRVTNELATTHQPAQQGSVPKGENDFGLDARYFHEKLRLILRDINSYTPTEMARALGRLAITATG